MARKASIAKQERRLGLIAKYRAKRVELKKIICDPNATEEERAKAMYDLNRLPRNSSPVRSNNRCDITGRVRGYNRKFGLSRLCFREFALKGLLPGITKSSW